MDLPPAEKLLATAIHCLIQDEQLDAAKLLLFCEAEYTEGTGFKDQVYLNLTGPIAAYKAFVVNGPDDDGHAYGLREEVESAFYVVTPSPYNFKGFYLRVQLVEIPPGWREELQEIAHGRRVHNQGVEIPGREIVEWGNLRFRSQSEARIAKALDAVGVLFLPNCLARLSMGNGRGTKEADFFVCTSGTWPILEVDGPFHPRAAEDHERDRLFQQHGIKITQRFPADRCYDDAPDVVREFLTLLERNG